jgi:hypothetical protein
MMKRLLFAAVALCVVVGQAACAQGSLGVAHSDPGDMPVRSAREVDSSVSIRGQRYGMLAPQKHSRHQRQSSSYRFALCRARTLQRQGTRKIAAIGLLEKGSAGSGEFGLLRLDVPPPESAVGRGEIERASGISTRSPPSVCVWLIPGTRQAAYF